MARPAQFDRKEILEKAMQAFWDQGYCATSMANLVEATDLKPGSLYAAFESKQALFLATLDHYGARSVQRARKALADSASPLAAIEQYFDELAAKIEQQDDRCSCFLVNSVLELSMRDDAVRQHIDQHFTQIRHEFLKALQAAQAQQQISASANCEALASFLMSNIWGLRVLAGTKPAPGVARQVVELIKQTLKA